jgi:hypothetical protein
VTGHAGGRGRSRGRAEDRSRSADVRVHARLGYPKQTRDLLGREAARDSTQHLALAVGERRDRTRMPREDAPGHGVPGDESDQE